MTKTVHRHEIPVDDQPHTVKLTSNPRAATAKHVEASHIVEFWAEHHGDQWASPRTFQVYGTGHPIPDNAHWHGTTQRIDGLVWHLFELPEGAP